MMMFFSLMLLPSVVIADGPFKCDTPAERDADMDAMMLMMSGSLPPAVYSGPEGTPFLYSKAAADFLFKATGVVFVNDGRFLGASNVSCQDSTSTTVSTTTTSKTTTTTTTTTSSGYANPGGGSYGDNWNNDDAWNQDGTSAASGNTPCQGFCTPSILDPLQGLIDLMHKGDPEEVPLFECMSGNGPWSDRHGYGMMHSFSATSRFLWSDDCEGVAVLLNEAVSMTSAGAGAVDQLISDARRGSPLEQPASDTFEDKLVLLTRIVSNRTDSSELLGRVATLEDGRDAAALASMAMNASFVSVTSHLEGKLAAQKQEVDEHLDQKDKDTNDKLASQKAELEELVNAQAQKQGKDNSDKLAAQKAENDAKIEAQKVAFEELLEQKDEANNEKLAAQKTEFQELIDAQAKQYQEKFDAIDDALADRKQRKEDLLKFQFSETSTDHPVDATVTAEKSQTVAVVASVAGVVIVALTVMVFLLMRRGQSPGGPPPQSANVVHNPNYVDPRAEGAVEDADDEFEC